MNTSEKILVSIIIPCYYSEKTIGKVVEMTIEEFAERDGYGCEFVLVNDGSTDGTYGEIRRLAAKYPFVKGVNLLRNFGQHNALMAALHYVNGSYVLGMDDDMQTHPSQIFRLVEAIQKGGYDLVYGHYGKRKNSFLKNISSSINEVTSRVLLDRPKEITSSNFWIITAKVAEEVRKYDSYNPYIDGIFYRTTHNIGNVEVEHHKREVGTSNYTFRKLFRLWLAYWNYSVIPLRISSVVGCFAATLGFVAAVVTVIWKLLDPTMVMGWASVVCILTFFFGLILVSLGIIGEYLGKILLTMNHTPQFIVRESVNAEKEEAEGDMETTDEMEHEMEEETEDAADVVAAWKRELEDEYEKNA